MGASDSDDDDEQGRFEAERDEVLKKLPQELKDKFGAIGFFLVENDDDDDDDEEEGKEKAVSTPEQQKVYYQPALIVSPYEVPPKPIRDIYWMDAFTKAKRSKAKLAALDYLVYVYGADDADDCYNFVSHDEFVSLEEAQEQGLDQLPEELKERIEKKKTDPSVKLSEVEEKLIRGLEEMKADVDKDPKDRKPHSKYAFVERHEESKDAKGPPQKKQKT